MKFAIIFLLVPFFCTAQKKDTVVIKLSKFVIDQFENYKKDVAIIKKEMQQIEHNFNHDLMLIASQGGVLIDSLTQYYIEGDKLKIFKRGKK